MDFNSLSNMKLSDFENIGKVEYNKGFGSALDTVVKLLGNRICEDYNADGVCKHGECPVLYELSEGLAAVKGNLQ
jgi:hypothetical protein